MSYAKPTRSCAKLGVLCHSGARPPVAAMISDINDHRAVYGVKPICRVLPIAPSTYYVHAARRADPEKQSVRTRSDAASLIEIQRVFEANFCVCVCGLLKVWRHLAREGIVTAGDRDCSLHGGAADAPGGLGGGGTRQYRAHHDPRPAPQASADVALLAGRAQPPDRGPACAGGGGGQRAQAHLRARTRCHLLCADTDDLLAFVGAYNLRRACRLASA